VYQNVGSVSDSDGVVAAVRPRCQITVYTCLRICGRSERVEGRSASGGHPDGAIPRAGLVAIHHVRQLFSGVGASCRGTP